MTKTFLDARLKVNVVTLHVLVKRVCTVLVHTQDVKEELQRTRERLRAGDASAADASSAHASADAAALERLRARCSELEERCAELEAHLEEQVELVRQLELVLPSASASDLLLLRHSQSDQLGHENT